MTFEFGVKLVFACLGIYFLLVECACGFCWVLSILGKLFLCIKPSDKCEKFVKFMFDIAVMLFCCFLSFLIFSFSILRI